MLFIAVMLGIGFGVLVLLALYLCMVISFVPPVIQPSNVCHILVLITAFFVFAASIPAAGSDADLSNGLSGLVSGLDKLHDLTAQVRCHHLP
jgi:hypothetical protein